MSRKRMQHIALVTALALAVSTTSCAYILHPERRGNRGGRIDTMSLVFDILWLIPGIIPGVVALAVDFSNGAIYTGGGKGAYLLQPGGQIKVTLPGTLPAGEVARQLISPTGQVVAEDRLLSSAARPAGSQLVLSPSAAAWRGAGGSDPVGTYTLALLTDDGRRATLPLRPLSR